MLSNYIIFAALCAIIILLIVYIKKINKIKYTKFNYKLKVIIPPMNDIETVKVKFRGRDLIGVIDPHHSQEAIYIYYDGSLYHNVKTNRTDWKELKRPSWTPKRNLMFAVLLKENGIAYQIRDL